MNLLWLTLVLNDEKKIEKYSMEQCENSVKKSMYKYLNQD